MLLHGKSGGIYRFENLKKPDPHAAHGAIRPRKRRHDDGLYPIAVCRDYDAQVYEFVGARYVDVHRPRAIGIDMIRSGSFHPVRPRRSAGNDDGIRLAEVALAIEIGHRDSADRYLNPGRGSRHAFH